MKIVVSMFLIATLAPAVAAADAADSCITCHSQLTGDAAQPAQLFLKDVHHDAGVSCADCHGGDPHDATPDAMSTAKGFRGKPERTAIPQLCARCHSDPAYMRRFNPRLRTDQFSEYLTSVHGQRLKQGDTKVAVCIDCHGAHGILPVSNPQAPVYPTNVPQTCARCHADPEHMKGYGVPTNQFDLYEKSVHAQALANGDTSAPTCATCHGNHGATPPGVSSVASVCGTCHAMNQQLFDKSPHAAVFAAMKLPGCVQCHSNHEVRAPTDAWVGVGQQSVCVSCHSQGDAGYEAAQKMADDLGRLKAADERTAQILDRAESSGMEVSSARVSLGDAHADLIKARVDLHAFNEADLSKDTDAGSAIAQKAYEAGVAALRERDFRRKGLGVALILIAVSITGLYLKIRQIESRPRPREDHRA
jgi:predicted CXXCH cytochrome family protein